MGGWVVKKQLKVRYVICEWPPTCFTNLDTYEMLFGANDLQNLTKIGDFCMQSTKAERK